MKSFCISLAVAIVSLVVVEPAKAQAPNPKNIYYFTSTNWWGGATFADINALTVKMYSSPKNYTDVYPAFPRALLQATGYLVPHGSGETILRGTTYFFPYYDYLVTEIYDWDGENLAYFYETFYNGKATGYAFFYGPKYANYGPLNVDIQGYHTFESTSITRY